MAPQREWFEKDYYKVLGVADTASQKDITRAYRKLAREHHPDANPGDNGAEERFKEISAAYDVVGDEDKRKEYDEVRRLGPVGGMFGGGAGARPGGFSVHDRERRRPRRHLSAVCSGSRARRPAATASRGAGPQRGADLETELHLSFEDAAKRRHHHGATSPATPSARPVTAAAPVRARRPASAPTAPAAGCSTRTRGSSRSARRARCAAGPARASTIPARRAGAAASSTGPARSRSASPPGSRTVSASGSKGRGSPGRNGGPTGDLYVVVHVASHPIFGRRGRDLTLTVPITFPEAALGADITVPTLDGSRSRCASRRARGRAARSGSRAGASTRTRGRATCW